MAITSMTKSIPMPRKRTRGLTIMIRSIINARTPLAMGCFYGVLIALLLAALYPSISKANLGSYLSSSVLSGLLGARITTFSGFTVFLGVELYSSFYGLLFGGIMAYLGGAALPINIENGTLDLALSRPISRTRYYLESWLAVLVCGAIIGLATVFAVLGVLLLRGRIGHAVGLIYQCQPRGRRCGCRHYCPGIPYEHVRRDLRPVQLVTQDQPILLRASHRPACVSSTDVVASIGTGGCGPCVWNSRADSVQQARFTNNIAGRIQSSCVLSMGWTL